MVSSDQVMPLLTLAAEYEYPSACPVFRPLWGGGGGGGARRRSEKVSIGPIKINATDSKDLKLDRRKPLTRLRGG
jgi:hypothetical protein